MCNGTEVVNIYTFKGKYIYIGRGSRLGNPYVIGKDGDREGVISRYKVDFYRRLEEEPDFREYVESLKGKILGCFCKPKACHGDIIKEYLDGS